MAETVRIDPSSHAALTEIARAKRIPLAEALSRAIEAYRREVFLDGVAADLAALPAKARWDDRTERDVWDATNGDGLADELEGAPPPNSPPGHRLPLARTE
jgi:hypothetical protein